MASANMPKLPIITWITINIPYRVTPMWRIIRGINAKVIAMLPIRKNPCMNVFFNKVFLISTGFSIS